MCSTFATLGGGWGLHKMGLEAPFLILGSAAACFWFGTVIGKHYLLSRVATLIALALWVGGLILSLVALSILILIAASHYFPLRTTAATTWRQ